MTCKLKAEYSQYEDKKNFLSYLINMWKHKDLIKILTWREIVGKYKGSFIGLGWSFIQPLIMLGIYTFVFSGIFKSKWGMNPSEGRIDFALALFMGLITFNIFSESVNAAPLVIINNVNYVKKVIFPLEILPVVGFLTALVNAVFSLLILIFFLLFFNNFIHWTVFLLPVVWFPMMLFSLGCCYFLASLGVFIRDVGVTVNILTTMLFFLSPIFYPISAIPEKFRIFCQINPIAIFVEDARRVVLWGLMPDWTFFLSGFIFSLFIFIFGFTWFMKTRKAFADVI